MAPDEQLVDETPAKPGIREPGSSEAPRQSWWQAVRPLVLRLHFYAGVLVAPFLVVAALTGLLYVFTPQLEQHVYDHELHVPPAATSHPLTAQVEVARAVRPGDSLKSVRPAPTPTDTTQVIFNAPDLPESYRRTVFVDPHTLEVRGVLDTYGSGQALPLRAWVDNLHRGLHLGDAGRLYSELAASWLWVVVLGGLALWIARRRPRRRLRAVLAPEVRRAGRRGTLSWHGATGVWLALGLLFLSATGLTWSVHAGENIGALRESLSWETPTVPTELPARSTARGDVGFDRVREAAAEHGITGAVEIAPPEDGGAYTVQQVQRHWPTQQDSAAVDPASGAVTATLRFADYPLMAKLSRWGIDAHMGLLFGWVNQLVLLVLGLGLTAMVFWGYRMWWLRGPASGFGRLPARGAWRRVPGRVMAPVILVAAFVAYALPVFGASLLLFLAVDAGLVALARRTADPTPGA
ncbi:putative iron-regulated membrane protein [Saccharopolyspora erythraea NRRL 2338]|uniref:Integral membrane protein n=2 Tax=Saccharopolyspora erythraea TaxID=1836 RepID=A4FGI9_SACEN|nr:PepSY-associated TM helix domain-containing protein [Saccharopolyspora erythraea]EQD83853.1 peptidase [Saccharopolyspora erythraea D]PFG96868.1 putative iron-regulated membrane protein [Saccharopolyspora erythraea NRRL 2338]QRK87104.1 PepSY domain-containing protein [Saccharopolyspora erythraea]CAM03164.1 integral membrane protein [Saccharopolyspora erythraea NRRL 2338]